MNNVFVVLEGLSGSGKTTIGEILSEKIDGVFYKTPAAIFRSARDLIDREADITARFLFYLGGIVQSSVEISKIQEQKSVVCDRFILTTLCYHRALGAKICFTDETFESTLKMPDYTFLITCDEKERLGRLYHRGLTYNDRIERRFDIETRYLKEYRKYSLAEIDNSSNDPERAVNAILERMKAKS